ncbi:MAG: cation diffusion facilitator family transporter [Acidobacteria bacterium]|nr:cation diffusion facilitator family transporter [Acidobacteriota bacterium]MCA1648864.1 cation diffusion facilitator family transporter [Acidobacteriota bacterium]
MAAAARARVLGPTLADRSGAVSRVLLRVLILNLMVAGAKLLFGYSTGAVSIISDGFHSLTDAAANVMGLVGVRASRKPPDEDHPYGHRKYETLAAAGIFVFLLFVVLEVLRAVTARFAGGEPPTVTAVSFAVMLGTLGVNLLVVRYEARKARTLTSELLLADAMHTRSDVLTSCAVLASLAGVRFGYPALDPVGGLVVAVFIARTGLEIARNTSHILSDRVVMNEEDIRRAVMSVPEVLGCHRIRSRGSLDHTFLDLHVWFAADTTLQEAHRLSHVVKDGLMHKYPQIADAIIHIEPPPPAFR